VFFFLSVSNVSDGKRASIFEISIFADRKVNPVGTFGRSKLKTPSSFRKRGEKLPRNYGKPLKMGFLISNDLCITIATNKK